MTCADNPVEWFLEISAPCNLRCLTCSRINDERFKDLSSTGDMKPEIMEKIDPLFEESLTVHSVGFGEPFINRHAMDYIRAIKKHDTFLNVMTDGTLLNGKEDDLIASKLNRLTVSMDGGTREVLDYFRRGARWDDVFKSLKYLNEKKKKKKSGLPSVNIEFMVMNGNISTFPKLVELAAVEWGVHGITAEALPQTVCEECSDFYMEQNLYNRPYEEVDALFNEAKAMAERYGLLLTGPYYDGKRKMLWQNARVKAMGHIDELGKTFLQASSQKTCFTPICTVPWTTTYVAFDGTVRPCCFSESAAVLGDLRKESFEEIWNGEEYQQLRQDILNDTLPESCKPCVANARIHGRAIFHKFAEYLQ
ncbi:MAG: radical SAM protein [Planctomycetota bacterium]